MGEVIDFIEKFKTFDSDSEELICKAFSARRSYYFAYILKVRFNRGTICYLYPDNTVVWVDDNDKIYNIYGQCRNTGFTCIPIDLLGKQVSYFSDLEDNPKPVNKDSIYALYKEKYIDPLVSRLSSFIPEYNPKYIWDKQAKSNLQKMPINEFSFNVLYLLYNRFSPKYIYELKTGSLNLSEYLENIKALCAMQYAVDIFTGEHLDYDDLPRVKEMRDAINKTIINKKLDTLNFK